jgi:PPOX class probable F420-dependent enzyme
MATSIPAAYLDLFKKKSFAHLATLMPDGSPQVTPVWCDFDGSRVIVNSARGRQKDKNMAPGARVALSICDPDNPYRYLEVRGTVAEVTENGADAHIDTLAQRYIGQNYPYRQPGEVRVMYKIEPTKTTQRG